MNVRKSLPPKKTTVNVFDNPPMIVDAIINKVKRGYRYFLRHVKLVMYQMAIPLVATETYSTKKVNGSHHGDNPQPKPKQIQETYIILWQKAINKYSMVYYSCRYELAFDDICNCRQLCALVCVCVCLIPYILAPVYAFRCTIDVSANKEENEHNVMTSFRF